MSILLALLVGLAVGAAGSFLLFDGIDSIVINLCLGVAGGLTGLAVYVFLLGGLDGNAFVDGRSLLSSALFALLFVAVLNLIRKIMPRRAASITGAENNDKNLSDLDKS